MPSFDELGRKQMSVRHRQNLNSGSEGKTSGREDSFRIDVNSRQMPTHFLSPDISNISNDDRSEVLIGQSTINTFISGEVQYRSIDIARNSSELDQSQRQRNNMEETCTQQILKDLIGPEITESYSLKYSNSIQDMLKLADFAARNNSYLAISILNKASLQLIKQNEKETIQYSEILYKKCLIFVKINKKDSFEKCIKQAQRIAQGIPQKNKSQFYTAKYKSIRVRFYTYFQTNYKEACKLGREAQKVFIYLQKQKDAVLLYTSLGWLYYILNQNNKQTAIKYFQNAYKLSQNVLNKASNEQSYIQDYLQVILRCGVFYWRTQEHEKALFYFKKFEQRINDKLKYSQIIDPDYIKVILNFFSAYSLFRQLKIQQAIEKFLSGLIMLIHMLQDHEVKNQLLKQNQQQVFYTFVDQNILNESIAAKQRIDKLKNYKFILTPKQLKQAEQVQKKFQQLNAQVKKYRERKKLIQQKLEYI